MDLSVSIGSLTLTNPLIAASGCFGYGVEYADVVDLSRLGGVAVKGLFLNEREGHAPPRIVETPAGMLNAIGLQGIGVHRFVQEKLPELRDRRAVVIVNICGTTIDEYCEVARILSDHAGVAAIELNISCPNIKEGGITFGCSLIGTHNVVSAVRKVTPLPVIPKLTPNVTDVASFARAAEEAGADAVSLVNTFLAMAIDVHTRRPRLTNIVGGLSGPAIRPIAVRMVYECRQAVRLPLIGMGGIATADDVLEFMIAGATAVQVGTANFVDPFLWTRLLEGLAAYMTRHGMTRLRDLTGTIDTTKRETAWISSRSPSTSKRRHGRSRWPGRCAASPAASKSAAACSPRRGRRLSASSCSTAIACSWISSSTTSRTPWRRRSPRRPRSASGWSTCTRPAARR
jgi:dihydroorotate dehydrogenase (NAD+) catalytic subunit